MVTGFHEDLFYNTAAEWRIPAHDPSATMIYSEDEFLDGRQEYRRKRGRVHMSSAHRLARGVKALTEARLRAKTNSRAVEKAVQQEQDLDSVCTGDTHVHVQCKHGFVLISGLQDTSIKPVCYRKQCKVEGERWLRREGLTQDQLVGAINSVCAVLPPLPDGKKEQQAEKAVTAEMPVPVSAKALLQAERESFNMDIPNETENKRTIIV